MKDQMTKYCVVCEKEWSLDASECCTKNSLVFVFKTNKGKIYYDKNNTELYFSDIQKLRANEINFLQSRGISIGTKESVLKAPLVKPPTEKFRVEKKITIKKNNAFDKKKNETKNKNKKNLLPSNKRIWIRIILILLGLSILMLPPLIFPFWPRFNVKNLILGSTEAIIRLIGFFIFIFLILKLSKPRYNLGPTLILHKFSIDRNNTNRPIEISGRSAGLIPWMLIVTQLDFETSFILNEKDILFRRSKLSGVDYQKTPLSRIASTHCGYYRPILVLIIAVINIIFAMTGILRLFSIIPGLIGLILVYVYNLNKSIYISIETTGGKIIGLVFKSSFIENIRVEINQALEVITLINQKVTEEKQMYKTESVGD